MNRRAALALLKDLSASLDATSALLPDVLEDKQSPYYPRSQKSAQLKKGVRLISQDISRTSPFADELPGQYLKGCMAFSNAVEKEYFATVKSIEAGLEGIMTDVATFNTLLQSRGKTPISGDLLAQFSEFVQAMKAVSAKDSLSLDDAELDERIERLDEGYAELVGSLQAISDSMLKKDDTETGLIQEDQ